MTKITQLQVNRSDYHATRVVEQDIADLMAEEILVSIRKFALTSNNVSYAVSGDMIGYWNYYPAEAPFGNVPVWGIAEVIQSRSPDIKIGERLWGFFPMASATKLKVGFVADDNFMDATEYRSQLPALYNQYRRTTNEPEFLSKLEDERCLLFPLFITSYLIYDYLKDNDFFGAKQVIIGSVSSKTGFGVAKLIHEDAEAQVEVVGMTSQHNVGFVEQLACCDQIVVYGNENQINPNLNTAYVDMSGNGPLTQTLHHHFKERMVDSCLVGATHWKEDRKLDPALPGARPTFFFAPAQISKRNKEWGVGVVFEKATIAAARMAHDIKDDIAIERIAGPESAAQIWKDMLDNKVAPNRGVMVSFSD